MKKYIFTLIFLFIPSLLLAKEIYEIPYLLGKIILDGKVEEEVWKQAKPIDNFYVFNKEKLSKYKTIAKLIRKEDALYLGIICFEPEMDKIRAISPDGGRLWREDSIEFFIYPENSDTYFHFIVNAIGSRFNSLDLQGSLPLWNWQAKTYKGKDYWSAEVRIPFKILRRFPEGMWTGNICRNRCIPGKEELSSWAKMKGSFHRPYLFNEFIFAETDRIASNKIKREIENMMKRFPFTNRDILIAQLNKEPITVEEAYHLLNILYELEDRIKNSVTEASKKIRTEIAEAKYNSLKRSFFEKRR